MTNDPRSALPPGFEGFDADDVFDVQTSTTTEEPWRSARPLRGLRLGDRVVVGRQKFDVIRAFDDYTVMAQKPGAKRKAFNVWQNGPTVEVREQRGSPETTMAGPVLASAPYDRVQVVRGDENRSMASYRHATSGQHLRSLSEMLRGSDPFPVLRDFYDSQGPRRQGWVRAIDALSTDELLGVAQIAASYGTAAGVELKTSIVEILRGRAHNPWSKNRARVADYGVTKEELLRQTVPLWEEAYAADPYGTMENTATALGREIFVWNTLSVREISALRRAIFPIVMEARG